MKKSKHQRSVEDFMRKAKQVLPPSPVLPCRDVLRLRARLIIEECLETIRAFGFEVEGGFGLVEVNSGNLIEIIDGCCDIAVVVTGTLSACGVPDLPFQNSVNENNLAKFGPGHSWREDGKLVKPPGHKPPDLAGILASMNEENQQRMEAKDA